MGFVSEELILQIVDSNDIVDIMGSYFPLKRAGRNFKATCPFHNEKTASLLVSPDKQIFHCFGCGAGGNIISFIMKQERTDFLSALKFLADKVNIEIPASSKAETHNNSIRNEFLKINKLAAEYYHNNLIFDKGSDANSAKLYLKNRDLSLDMVKQFNIGVSLNKWDGLLNFLVSKGIDVKTIEGAGLILERENKTGYYDRFRNRIIFPILDTMGHCRAFGARTTGVDPVKYINSPETMLYTKGQHLYGFSFAKQTVLENDYIILVEGYLDCIICHKFGYKNVVASLGTALTVEQIRLIRRYTKNIVMLFDTDNAGISAMLRSIDILLTEEMNVKVAILEQGKDPDLFLRLYGKEAFKEKLDKAVDVFDFKFDYLIKTYDKNNLSDKATIATEMLALIHRLNNEIEKNGHIKKLANDLQIDYQVIMNEYNKVGETLLNRLNDRFKHKEERLDNFVKNVEHSIVKLLLEDDSLITETVSEVSPTDFKDKKIRVIISKIFDMFENGKKINILNLMNSFEDDSMHTFISSIVSEETIVLGDRKKMHRDYLLKIKKNKLKHRLDEIRTKLRQAESSGNHPEVKILLQELNTLIKK